MSQPTMISSPPYPLRHEGPALVVGNAFCMADDLAAAHAIFGDVPVIAVNGAAREVRAAFLFSAHPARFVEPGYEWKKHQIRLFGGGFTVHGARERPNMPWVDYWWGAMPGGGGSAWGARKLAFFLGFSPVILCGCPLVPGCYAGYRPGMVMATAEGVEPYRREIEADKEWHEGAFSMSGKTKEILGLPCP